MVTVVREVALTTSVVSIPYNDAVQKAVELVVDQSRTWAQVTTVLIGVLGALWVAKGDEPQLALRRGLWAEILMWCAGVAMLLLGLYAHNEYLEAIAAALEAGGVTAGTSTSIPDVFASKYDALRSEQLRLVISGATASLVAVFSVRHFSGGLKVGT